MCKRHSEVLDYRPFHLRLSAALERGCSGYFRRCSLPFNGDDTDSNMNLQTFEERSLSDVKSSARLQALVALNLAASLKVA